jgi:hypothetical protein
MLGAYMWNSKLSDEKISIAQQLDCNKILFKCADIVYEKGAWNIIDQQKSLNKFPENISAVPVIHLQGLYTQNMNAEQLINLAELIIHSVKVATPSFHPERDELQLDMDWDDSNLEAYTDLILQLKTTQHVKHISCTITLSNAAYTKPDNLPPASSFTLMLYDIQSLENTDTTAEVAMLEACSKFPKKLALALPYMQRAQVITAEGSIKASIPMQADELDHNDNFIFQSNNCYQCLQSCTLHGYGIKAGDKICVEEAELENLLRKHQLFKRHCHAELEAIYIFSLEAMIAKPIPKAALQELLQH